MAFRDTRMRRAVVSGVKLGLSAAAVLATAAGWVLFGASDTTASVAQVAQPAAEQAPTVLEEGPERAFPGRHSDRRDRWRAAPPREGGEGEDGDDDEGFVPAQPAPQPPSAGGGQGLAPETGGSAAQPSAPRRPVTRTHSSR